MGASFTKCILKNRALKGPKSGAEAEWSMGWTSPPGPAVRRPREKASTPPAKPLAAEPESASSRPRQAAVARTTPKHRS